ncbi:anaerobic carbon-monoxide dehydrogenase catalytic subunit [candidate division KSB3 bacterium]|uniref:Carbon monoxide dehydrogenase n=1 Tax=candidate division KSB3 bacterium TaxID=2044937 RepID=A0A9D5JUY9_9BACT|nr:anaerobic carbon-monoxide dehydrogenase catalytic subunit [candidate division KSB3 bacterium]MBD3324758.1 anaerobic carbon-monoxide dehydrogenase catalytic subunit [candidate division KSB3 bacterium]
MATELKYADKASQEMIKRAAEEQIATVWDRYAAMQPQCGFGTLGLCCRNCAMGPCRIDPFGEGPQVGVCGANADTIAARNILRMIAGGSAAHSDHGRDVAHTLLLAAENEDFDYKVQDVEKLKAIAEIYEIETQGREIREIAWDVAWNCLEEFGRQKGELKMASTAPPARQKLWKELDLIPRSIDREVVEAMHRTHMGVDADYKNIIRHGMRAALADGWGGSMVGTELSDVIFNSPRIQRSSANLGVLQQNHVNIVVHGHEPTLSDIIAVVSQSEEMLAKAREKGAEGIRVAGICCTANEILMRHGIPIAGNFLQQELAILTGSVEAMVVDVQCLMPGLIDVAKCFHTDLITTSPKAKMPGFKHIEFHEDKAVKTASQIIETAIDNFSKRNGHKSYIPQIDEGLVAGFTTESVFHFLGGKYRSTYRPLNNAIIEGRLRGAAGVIGCSSPSVEYEEGHIQMVKELIKNDTLVVTTGCDAVACAKHGLMKPESAFEFAGEGLQEICQAVGIPPILHVGSCVDNSRILRVLSNIVAEGGLGDDISDLPAAGAAPEWMSEKAVSIGFYFVASGVYTMIGQPLPMMGSKNLHKYLTDEVEQEVGGKWAFEADPIEAAHKMLRHIDKKRKALKLKPLMYPQAFQPEE